MIEALFSFRFCGFFVSFDSDKHLVVDRRLALGIERSKFRFVCDTRIDRDYYPWIEKKGFSS